MDNKISIEIIDRAANQTITIVGYLTTIVYINAIIPTQKLIVLQRNVNIPPSVGNIIKYVRVTRQFIL